MTSARWLLTTYAVLLALLLLVSSSHPPTWIIQRSAELGSDAGLPAALTSSARMDQVLNVALPDRTASHSDVVANTAGALVGAAAARLVLSGRGAARDD